MLFNFKKKKLDGQYSPNQSVKVRSRGGLSKKIQANMGGNGGSGGSGSMGGGSGNFNVSRYSGTSMSMEQGNITQEWMPQDPVGLHTLWRQIYAHDSIGGPAVDLIANLPWSDWDLQGVKDKGKLAIFEKAMTNLQVETMMTPLTVEYLVIGRVTGSLLFDDSIGTWTGFMPHDPDFVDITPREIFGVDPKLDLRLSPGMKETISSNDKRDREVLEMLPQDLLRQMRAGKVELDPLNTLFVPRRTLLNDYIGTSVYTRLVPFWALEQNLISGTLIASKRRQRSVLHLSIGLDDVWEPEPEEIDDIINLFMQADEDPQGAIVATRKGVESSEIRSGSDFWKISDEIGFINESKMKALAINESFLSGDANYSTMEVALSVFVEQVRALRENLTRRIFYHKVFPTLARAYGMRKVDKNDLEHRIRVNKNKDDEEHELKKQVTQTLDFVEAQEKSDQAKYNAILIAMKKKDTKEVKRLQQIRADEAKQIPESELLIPTIHWHKQLRPEADENYLNILGTMEEKGIPIPLKTWASAGGIDLTRLFDGLNEDAKIRKDIQEWKRNSIDDDEAAFASMEQIVRTKKVIANNLPLWKEEKSFLGLSKESCEAFIMSFAHDKRFPMLSDVLATERAIAEHVDGNHHQIEAMKFIMKRIGLCNFPMNKEIVEKSIQQMQRSNVTTGALLKEVQVIQRYAMKKKNKLNKAELERAIDKYASEGRDNFLGKNSNKVYSGF